MIILVKGRQGAQNQNQLKNKPLVHQVIEGYISNFCLNTKGMSLQIYSFIYTMYPKIIKKKHKQIIEINRKKGTTNNKEVMARDINTVFEKMLTK